MPQLCNCFDAAFFVVVDVAGVAAAAAVVADLLRR